MKNNKDKMYYRVFTNHVWNVVCETLNHIINSAGLPKNAHKKRFLLKHEWTIKLLDSQSFIMSSSLIGVYDIFYKTTKHLNSRPSNYWYYQHLDYFEQVKIVRETRCYYFDDYGNRFKKTNIYGVIKHQERGSNNAI